MKKEYLSFLFCLLFINMQAQSFEWAKRAGWSSYDFGYGITTDNAGNVYVAGKYEDTAHFSGTTLPCAGNHDIFLAKYSSAGTLNWIRTAGGILGDYAHALACDGSSNVYIAGEIEGYGNQIFFPGSAITLNCIGENDVFIAKYDLNGTLVWAKSAGGNKDDKALGVTYDNFGNVYICGFFTDTATFGTTTIYGHGGADLFIAKYDLNGNFVWVQQAGGAGRDEAKSIKCDTHGNVYICGMYADTCVFGYQTLIKLNGFSNAFLAKYTPDGTLSWVKTADGQYDDVAWSLTLDNTDKIYVTGEFNIYALFGGSPLTTSGQCEAFVACYNSDGSANWAKAAGGNTMLTRARGIGCDGTDLYITGQFGGTVSFDSISLTSVDNSDIFMAKINNAGSFIWAMAVGGIADAFDPGGYESGNAICAEASGNVYATGALLEGGVFGSTTLLPYDRTDIFITKIIQEPQSIGEINFQDKTAIYPNPGNGNFIVDLAKLTNQKIEIKIFNCLGQCIEKRTDLPSSKINLDLSAHKKGIYFIEINTDQTIFRKKIILQ